MAENKNIFSYRRVRIATAVMLVIIIAYLILCFIGGRHDFNRDTTINGIDVSNMTVQEASDALNHQFLEDTKDLVIQMEVEDKLYPISLKDNVSLDANTSVLEIHNKNKSSFITRGFYYLMGKDYTVAIEVKDSNKLKDSISKSGILDYNTSIATTYKMENDHIVFTKGHDGKKVELSNVIKQIKGALADYSFKDRVECELVDHRISDQEIVNIHKAICVGPKNATLDKKNGYKVIDSVDGVEFNLDEAKKAYNNCDEGDSFRINAKFTKAKISKGDLEKHLFKDVLGTYSTHVGGASVRKNNVRLAGMRCNSIILPGEEFSFNKTVGKRTADKGFGAAGAYVDGQTVQELGGGVCQTSSTLYNAVMLANLEVTLRYPHSYYSSYVPVGRDATVSWGGPDFKFKNNTDYPIKIVMSYSNDRLYAKIVGTNIDGIKVKITSEQLSSTPYAIKEVNDPNLEVGKRKIESHGHTGATAVSYRYVYDRNGRLISKKQEAYSRYKKRDEIVRVGTKPVATPPAEVQPTTPDTPATPPVQ